MLSRWADSRHRCLICVNAWPATAVIVFTHIFLRSASVSHSGRKRRCKTKKTVGAALFTEELALDFTPNPVTDAL